MGKIGLVIYAIHKGWVGGHPPAVTPPLLTARHICNGQSPMVVSQLRVLIYRTLKESGSTLPCEK